MQSPGTPAHQMQRSVRCGQGLPHIRQSIQSVNHDISRGYFQPQSANSLLPHIRQSITTYHAARCVYVTDEAADTPAVYVFNVAHIMWRFGANSPHGSSRIRLVGSGAPPSLARCSNGTSRPWRRITKFGGADEIDNTPSEVNNTPSEVNNMAAAVVAAVAAAEAISPPIRTELMLLDHEMRDIYRAATRRADGTSTRGHKTKHNTATRRWIYTVSFPLLSLGKLSETHDMAMLRSGPRAWSQLHARDPRSKQLTAVEARGQQPAASDASVSCVPWLLDLTDGAFDAAIGLVCKGLLPEGPGVPTPLDLEQHGRPCFVCRFVESDVQHE